MWLSDWRNFLWVAVLLTVTSCGFRLQGSEYFPETLETTYIETADRYSLFYRELISELEQGGVSVVDSSVAASAVIRIESDQAGQRVLSVSGRNVPTEYDVFYNVVYSVWVDGEETLPSTALSLNQAYTYDATQVLGKNREAQVISKSLAQNLVRQVSQQLTLL